jgi:hypothetical protein
VTIRLLVLALLVGPALLAGLAEHLPTVHRSTDPGGRRPMSTVAVHMPTGQAVEILALGMTGPTVAGTAKVRFLADGFRTTVNAATLHELACPLAAATTRMGEV